MAMTGCYMYKRSAQMETYQSNRDCMTASVRLGLARVIDKPRQNRLRAKIVDRSLESWSSSWSFTKIQATTAAETLQKC
jgi:hypothetical protein